jgi:hypothetical protein
VRVVGLYKQRNRGKDERYLRGTNAKKAAAGDPVHLRIRAHDASCKCRGVYAVKYAKKRRFKLTHIPSSSSGSRSSAFS